MNLTITGYSTALFATWYFVEELGILFDAGEGITANLLQKSRKIKHVLISHADRDHLTGLLQFNQLNARSSLHIHYPADCGSFPALADFCQKFDPHIQGTTWHPITDQSRIAIKDDFVVEPVQNGHVKAVEGVTKSLSYKVMQIKRKLKPELANLSGLEIKKIKEEKGIEATTNEIRTNVISYSGDTPVEDYERFNHSKILIHEATFIDQVANNKENRHPHSYLEEVMEMVASIEIEQLILGHFSSRYSSEHIDTAIRELRHKYAINIPVYRVLPGQVHWDILQNKGVKVNK
ncbi:MBL fold metallo-hydrolase [uncultured Microscilla sp.]|uniref:MBL fold metallo-hydrolase n=1 Tax=uncultured Microscilla sp. TaxID=432653 RepID=UPI00261659C8|nr:MBL fold metallo-hydrolase [uncultured Microscilla sp.]